MKIIRQLMTKEQIKSTGATFTPLELANFLSDKLMSYINGNQVSVLDPACGDGELLLSISEKLSKVGIEFSLIGYDSNQSYLTIASDRLSKFDSSKELINQDFLEAVDLRETGSELNFGSSIEPRREFADIVIANPPYVRTQILGTEKAQALANKFKLKGRVDLYHPFLISMTESLKPGGMVGVITSNKYLSNKSGESIRKYLSKNYHILEVIDLGDTKLFDAAVLPAIFIGRKRGQTNDGGYARFTKLYENLNTDDKCGKEVNSIYDILESETEGLFNIGSKKYKMTTGNLRYNSTNTSHWELLSNNEVGWVDTINASATCLLGDLFKVRVGIKTTCDEVFISDKWDNPGISKPEDSLLKPLVSQENIQAWGAIHNDNLKVLYTHYFEDGKRKVIDIRKYPNAEAYLLSHYEKLSSRTYVIEAKRKWYEIWVPQKPELWNYPKLVFPDISSGPRFYYDEDGKIVNGNCYWIVAQTQEQAELLLFIQGIANSKVMTKYHDMVFNNKLYSGKRRYITQYIERYPIPNINSPVSREIIELVRQLNRQADLDQIRALEEQLELRVESAFNL